MHCASSLPRPRGGSAPPAPVCASSHFSATLRLAPVAHPLMISDWGRRVLMGDSSGDTIWTSADPDVVAPRRGLLRPAVGVGRRRPSRRGRRRRSPAPDGRHRRSGSSTGATDREIARAWACPSARSPRTCARCPGAWVARSRAHAIALISGVSADRRRPPRGAVSARGARSCTTPAPSSSRVSRNSSRSASRVRWLLMATRTARAPSSTVSLTIATPLSWMRSTSSALTSSSRPAGTPARGVAQAHHVAADRGEALEVGVRVDPVGEGVGLRDVAVHDPAERVGAVGLERQPDPQRPEPPREGDAVLVEPHLAGGQPAGGVLQVLRHDREGRPVRRLVAHQGEPDVDRRLHPLVQVEREGVGALEAAHGIRVRAQREEAADGAVDVQPEALALGEVGDGRRGRRPSRC